MNRRPTPETDAVHDNVYDRWDGWSDNAAGKLLKHSHRLENERDELKSDLEFRRGLFQLQEQQLNEVRAERDDLKFQLATAMMAIRIQERREQQTNE